MCVQLCMCVVAHVCLLAIAHHLGTAILLIVATLVYWYVYDCVTVSFLLLLFIGIERPLFRNFGCTFVYVGAHARVCVRACV